MTNRANRCSFVKPDGSRCLAAALKGTTLCFFHNPDAAKVRQKARRRGAQVRNASHSHPETASYVQLAKTAAKAGPILISPLIDAFLKVRDGEMDTRTANSLAYIAATLSQMGQPVAADDGPPLTELQRRMPRWEAVRISLLDLKSPLVRMTARQLGMPEPIDRDDPRIHQLIQRIYDVGGLGRHPDAYRRPAESDNGGGGGDADDDSQ